MLDRPDTGRGVSARPTTVEHLDVLIVGAGLSGIGAAHHLQTDCPWATLRDLRGPRRHRRHVGPVPLPGHPLRLRHVHPRLLVPAVDRRAVDRRRRLDPAVHRGHRGRGRHRPAHPLRPPHRSSADWSTDDARWTVTAERTDTGETVELTCGVPLLVQRLLPLRPRLPARLRRAWTASSGTIVHPQAWPEDLDYAGKRVVVIGSGATAVTLVPSLADDGRPRHDAAALAHLHRVGARSAAPSPPRCARCCPPARPAPAIRWIHALGTQGIVPAEQAPARAGQAGPAQGPRARAARGLRHRHPLHARATTRGTSASASVPDGDLFQAIRDGTRLGGHRPHRHASPRRASASQSGAELEADIIVTATGLELLFIGGIELTVDGEPVDPAERLTYKGMMLEGVPNLALAVGYTNASWTLKADLTCDYVGRLLEPPAPRPGCASARPVNRDAAVDGDAAARAVARATSSGPPTEFPKQGSPVPVAGAPELPARLPGAEAQRPRRRRHGSSRTPRPARGGARGRRRAEATERRS